MDDEHNTPLAKLLWSDPQSGAAREFVLREGVSATIGRAAASDVLITEMRVSRQHALISCHEGRFSISDLGSSNGTAVNSQPITGGEAHILQDGDRIVFGATETLFRLSNHLAGQNSENKT